MNYLLGRTSLSVLAVLMAPLGFATTLNPSYDYDTTQDGYLYYDDASNVLAYLNTGNSTDVNQLAIDAALAVINNDPNAAALLALAEWANDCDVNNSGTVSSLDALNVINGLYDDPFQNPVNPYDVNDDSIVDIVDVLICINEFNSRAQDETLLLYSTACNAPFFDVTGNNQFTAEDILDLLDQMP
ncbi:MAG: dockerin type I domain-containing protein [Planctomycetota bacterium]